MARFVEIDFLEAGQKSSGDAIALRYRDDNDVDHIHVVDGGYTDDGDKLVDHIRKHYDSATSIDHVVLTHPDGDHAAGLKKVLDEFEVGALWMNRPWNHVEALLPRFDYPYTYDGLVRRLRSNFPHTADLERIAGEQCVTINDAFQGSWIGDFLILTPSRDRYVDLIVESEKTPEAERGATTMHTVVSRVVALVRSVAAMWGQENLKGASDGTSRENETSVVQLAQLCGKKILLTGDAGVEALNEACDYAMARGVTLPGVDWFDVPHHGSRRNLSSDVLDRLLGPKLDAESNAPVAWGIVSANGKDADHPRKAVVRALIHRGARVFQTKGALHVNKDAPARQWSAAIPLEYPTDMEE